MSNVHDYNATYCWFDLRDYTGFTEKNNPINTLLLIKTYYKLIEKFADKYKGEIIACLGDGIGVIFRDDTHTNRAFQMAKDVINDVNNNSALGLKVGVGIETGNICEMENLNIHDIKKIHAGPTIVRTFRIGSLLGKIPHDFLVTKEVQEAVSENLREGITFLLNETLKGFSDTTSLYTLKQ